MSDSSWKHRFINSAPFVGVAVASTLVVLGGAWYFLRLGQPPLDIPVPTASQKTPATAPPPQVVASRSGVIQQLALIPADQRGPYLEKLSQSSGADRNQGRFMLAADALAQKQGEKALAALDGLENDEPVLAAEVLTLRAKAYRGMGKATEADQTWQTLIRDYKSDPAAVEGLFALAKQDPKYGDQAIASFPAHPLSVAIAVGRLKTQPKDLSLLRQVARHGHHLTDLKTYLKRLTDTHAAQLMPEDWHAIGFAYWEKLTYKEAGQAYARAPKTPLNFYRAARGLQLGNEKKAAIAAYQKLVQTFPQSKEAAQAYLKLGGLLEPPVQRFPQLEKGMQLAKTQGRLHLVAEGLQLKASLEKQLKRTQAQAQTEKTLLDNYPTSLAAAELRWARAQGFAKQKNYAAAVDHSWAIAQSTPKANLAPKAAFWSAQWAQKLAGPQGEQQKKKAFDFLWNQHPDSYYTWRSGSLSGWPVGDFKTVRDLKPQPNWPNQQLPLAAGDEAIQSLYQMGQFQQAWKRWLVAFDETREQPSIPEQQTDGLIRIGVGEYLDGIFMLNNLDDRLAEEPQFETQVRQWRSHPGFWYALYPLAYYPETAGWAQNVNLNPLLALGLMRQESRFQPQIKSVVGAVGLMQIMPDTGTYIAGKLGQERFDLEVPNDNIQFGTWYLDEVHQTYGNDSILAIASYNAGPGNVAEWVKRFPDLPPDEFINAIPFDETRNYVTAVLENHWNYLRLYDPKYKDLVPNPFP